MATLAQLEKALVNAGRAGDTNAARKLAVAIKKERASRDDFDTVDGVKLAPIPGMYDNAQVRGTTAGPPPTSLGEKIVGAGENVLAVGTGATGGTIGMLGGMLKGLADNILSGKYGTQEGVDIVAKAAEEGANMLTYTPRTEAGQQQGESIGEVMKHAAPFVGLAPELGVIGKHVSMAKPVIRTAVKESVSAPIAQATTNLAEQVKAKIVQPTSGKTQPTKTYEVYRGTNETNTPNDAGVAGKGPYYAGRVETAEQYAGKSGKVIKENIQLENPLELTYSELNEMQKGLYGKVLTGFEPELSAKFDAHLRSLGHDGVVLFDPEISTTVPSELVKFSGTKPPPGAQSAGAAAVEMGPLRQAAADELPIPIKLTEGQKSRDFEQQRFERETAKQGEIGEPIRARFQDQNLKLQQNMDAFIDSTGAELTELRDIGIAVDKPLRARAAKDKVKIRALYKEFEKSDEYNSRVDLTPIAEFIKNSESAKSVAPILNATEQELNRLAALSYTGRGADKIKTTLGDAYQLRKFVNKVAGADPTNIKFARDLKEVIDTATKDKGGEKYKKADAARVQYANDYENFGLAKQLLNTKRGSTDRAIAMEDVLHKSVVSPTASLDTVMKLRQLLESEGPAGQQAWKELQGGTLRHIRDEALKGVTRDSAGNQVVSASALDRAITQLDKGGKLDFILGKKKAEQIRTVNEVAKDVLTSPPGVVNTSNTATVLAGLLDVAISGTTGVPAPVASTFRLVTSRIKDAKLRARVKQSLGE